MDTALAGRRNQAGDRRLLTHPGGEVCYELTNSFIRLWVADHRLKELGWYRHNVGSRLDGFVYVHHVTDAADDYFSCLAPFLEGGPDLADHRGRIIAGIAN